MLNPDFTGVILKSGLIGTRRYTVRSKGLKAIKAIEEERNKKEAKNLGEDRVLTGA